MAMFMEKYINECVVSFHRASIYLRTLMDLEVNDACFNEDVVVKLLKENELKRYYKNRNDIGVLMLDSINQMNNVH